MVPPRCLLILAVLVLPGLQATASDLSVFEQHPNTAPGVATKPSLQLYVTLSDKLTLGQTDAGERYIVPITGGYFFGDGVEGEVLSGGADWQLVRPDGVKEYVARYSIRTDDGKIIQVDNRGIGHGERDSRYRLTAPKFHAPIGRYEWLNRSLFVGTITSIKEPRAVIIRAYQVQ